MTRIWTQRAPVRILFVALMAVAVVGVVVVARHHRSAPKRCDAGFVQFATRCCAPGQTEENRHCRGVPQQCPPGFHVSRLANGGCVVNPRRVLASPVTLRLGPNDWQSEQVPRMDRQLPALWVDVTEVTHEQWQTCVASRQCSAIAFDEPGQPVTLVTPEEAQQYCAWVGGRLPHLDERIGLAAGNESRRYPWGQTGLVCRRAMYGVINGPCAESGDAPDIAGCHVAGQTPDGIMDLAGNAAELAVDDQHRTWVCGGSYRSATALELKSWACALFSTPARDIGWRCVYDQFPGDPSSH